MTVYFVATLARYVLVEAADEDEARRLGHDVLYELYADLRERLGKEVPININVVRPATPDEIQLWNWHRRIMSCDAASRN